MLRLLSDEDLAGAVVRGLLQRLPGLDFVRAQDVGLMRTPDPDILEWAAANDRILVSGDRRTLSAYAWDRVARGLFLPGVFLLRRHTTTAGAIDALELIALTSEHNEWVNQVVYIPL
jgi:Domain of unknown function (DUF5615)